MLLRLFNKKFYALVIPTILFFIFFSSYAFFSKSINVAYWDEMLWVGNSFHFEFFIHKEFNNPLWQSYESYDEPKLAQYMYGAWLYPTYLMEKSKVNVRGFDYTKFLISKNLYMIDDKIDNYRAFDKQIKNSTVKFKETDNGPPLYYLKKYGINALKTIQLIYQARMINFFLLALSVVVVYLLASCYLNKKIALLIALLYGFNPLLIEAGIVATSEALFILLFNSTLLFMSLYLIRKKPIFYLLLLSVLTGLCISTKFTGTTLLVIFFAVSVGLMLLGKRKRILKTLLHLLLSIILSVSIFVLLNPFVYKHPKSKTIFMYTQAVREAKKQANKFPKDSLPSPISRINRIYDNFFSPKYFKKFNGVYKIPMNSNFAQIIFILFLTGIIYQLVRIFKVNKKDVLLLTFLGIIVATMSSYLLLDWSRYYIQLVIFAALYEVLGIVFYLQIIKKIFIKIYRQSGLVNQFIRKVFVHYLKPLFKNRLFRISFLLIFILLSFIIYQSWPKPTCNDCNLIIISIDTLRADSMSVYGYNKNTTPNIDKWAKDAYIFTNVKTSVPSTYPSFSTLMTGIHPAESRIFSYPLTEFGDRSTTEWTPIEKGDVTLAELLKKNGYQTAAFGENTGLNAKLTHLDRGFDTYKIAYLWDSAPTIRNKTSPMTGGAISWLETNKNKKVFLWLHLMEPHSPYLPSEQFQCKFNPKYCSDIEERGLDPLETERKSLSGCQPTPIAVNKVDLFKTLYDGEIASADQFVDKILKKLTELHLDKKSIVVLYGDHGEGFDHNFYFNHNQMLYDSFVHIPLIIKYPSMSGKKIDSLIQNNQIFRTLTELLGIKAPLNILVENNTFTSVFSFFDRYIPDKYLYFVNTDLSKYGIQSKKYKYIYSTPNSCLLNNQREELYDLSKDPKEEKNIVKDLPSIAKTLRAELDSYIKRNNLYPLKLKKEVTNKNISEEDRKLIEKLKSLGY